MKNKSAKLSSVSLAVKKIKEQQDGKKIIIQFESSYSFNDERTKLLLGALKNAKGPVSLDLSSKNMGFVYIKSLFKVVSSMESQVTIYLSDNHIDNSSAGFIASAIKDKKGDRLKIVLKGNDISEPGIILLVNAIEDTECAHVDLDLRGNKRLTGSSAEELARVMQLKNTQAVVSISDYMLNEFTTPTICRATQGMTKDKCAIDVYVNSDKTRMIFESEIESSDEEDEGANDTEESVSQNDNDQASPSDDMGGAEKVKNSESKEKKSVLCADEVIIFDFDMQYFQKEQNKTKEEKEYAENIAEIYNTTDKTASVENESFTSAYLEEFEITPEKTDNPSTNILGLTAPISA